MAYADLNTIHNPSTGVAPPATWGDQVRDNFEYFNTMLPQGQGVWGSHSSVVLTQSVTVSRSVVYSRYHKNGRNVRAQGYATATSSGTAAQIVTVTLPFTAVQSSIPVGILYIFDASASLVYIVPAYLVSVTTLAGLVSGSAGLSLGASAFTAALASGDSVLWDVGYESTT